MTVWDEIVSIDTVQYSDSSEISPDKQFCLNCCYQPDESSKSRNGSVLLIKLDDESAKVVAQQSQIDGILDSCWTSPNEFILAGASGNLHAYSVESGKLVHRNSVEINGDSLCLSVDYHDDRLICSTSTGEVAILDSHSNAAIFRDVVHSFEAWVAHLSRHDGNLFFSGGDDCKFVSRDLRSRTKSFSKNFEGGCTSIQSHPTAAHIVSTGSYDETLKLWDLRAMGGGPVSAFAVGGGVWRHKWCPAGGALVLVAAMYAGFVAVRTDVASDYLLAPPQPSAHSSGGLAYGADWVARGSDYLIGACSFYDHRWSLSRLALV